MSQTARTLDRPADLYKADIVAWARHQARLMRDGRFSEIDWEHVIEEIEDVGDRYEDELSSRFATQVQHLLKLQLSPSDTPRTGWLRTVRRTALQIEFLLEDHPSLAKPEVIEPLFSRARRQGASRVALDLFERGEISTKAEVLNAAERLTLTMLTDETSWPAE